MADSCGTGGPHSAELVQSLAVGRHWHIGPGMAMPKKLSLPTTTVDAVVDRQPQPGKSLVTGGDLASNLASRQRGTQRTAWDQADAADD